jgi:hypothetical protein
MMSLLNLDVHDNAYGTNHNVQDMKTNVLSMKIGAQIILLGAGCGLDKIQREDVYHTKKYVLIIKMYVFVLNLFA